MFPLQMDEGGHEWGSNVKLGYNPMLVVFRMYPSCHCLTKSARTEGAGGVIVRMALVKGYRFTWGEGHFFGQNLLFLIGRDARLQKTL